MAKIDKLVEDYFSPPQKISFDMLYEMVTNILEQKQTGTAFEDVVVTVARGEDPGKKGNYEYK